MFRYTRYFVITGIVLIFSIFIFTSNFTRVVYINDYAKSLLMRITNSCGGNTKSISIIRTETNRKYRKSFEYLPAGVFHFGNVFLFQQQQNTSLDFLVADIIELTDYYKRYRLRNSIVSMNRINKNIINAGETVLIDGSLAPFVIDNSSGKTSNIKNVRGLYYSGDSAGGELFLQKLPEFRKYGINTIVFDAKDVTGIVQFKSQVKEVVRFNLNRHAAVDNLPKLIRECRNNNIYIIARIAVFRDHLLYMADPSIRIKSRSTGKDWSYKTHEMWCDPGSKKVQDYNIALAVELAEAGVDEIQFDYIRFPTLGNQKDIAVGNGKTSRMEIITAFLNRAHTEILKAGSVLSIDIFGVVAWGKDVDINSTGQQVNMLAGNCDVISPMVYPSHFSDNFDGYSKPGAHPYYFVYNGCKKVMELSINKVPVRPWLQAFAWHAPGFGVQYIIEQVKAARDAGASGYLFWNAANRYEETIKALSLLQDKK